MSPMRRRTLHAGRATLKPAKWAVSALIGIFLVASSPAYAQKVVITGWGGPWNEAYREGIWDPFEEETGIEVIEDQYNGEIAKIRSQIESGVINWDMVSVEGAERIIGCEEGLYEKINWEHLGGREQFLDYAVSDCGVGSDIWSTVLAYDAEKIGPEKPKSWADFWNVEKWQGKRGLRLLPKETLEIALMADGVPAKQVYDVLRTPEGVDRAFAKLDELKPHVVWWESGSQMLERLGSGEVIMTSAWNGELTATARANNRAFEIAWEAGFLLGIDQWVILKGAPNKKEAMEFLKYYSRPEVEVEFSKRIPYGVPHPGAYELMDDALAGSLPSSPDKAQWAMEFDHPFWVENLESLTQRLNAWAAQ